MTTVYCTGEFSFDIADVSDENLDAEFRRRKELVSVLKGEWQEGLEEKEAADFSASELVAALNGKGLELNPWAFEVYRMIAEGRTEDAMDAMRSEIPQLAPPSHERALADLLTGRTSAHG
ncbi:hypothetical protein EYC79_17995 [Agrobacterium cavarae]|uniref:Uncharacterized protein n=1 Tax=Agrobacterium cavarae TaxID=2528239 RepID=A0ABY1Y609_9HYPH|nr:hypothetical protein [Agrobacterium cavarae]TBN10844.1 hypothetical protein EYC79_17995 [Agrobacterium cavarae]